MDTTPITATAAAAGTMPLPAIVSQLLAAGLESYHVDYVGRRRRFSDGMRGRPLGEMQNDE